MKNITQTEWVELTSKDDNKIILDVRTPREWEEGIIKNAVLINIMEAQSFMDAIEKLDKSKHYYIYCRSGGRSGQACQVMESMGFQTTYNLLGGMMEWNGEVNTSS
ncbi:MAG: rhodanese-like domain-containing protein [Flavobacteriaceae bacterium]